MLKTIDKFLKRVYAILPLYLIMAGMTENIKPSDREKLIMSHFGNWLEITPETQEAARIMNEISKNLSSFIDEVNRLLQTREAE